MTEEEAKDVLMAHKMQAREIKEAKEQQAALIERQQNREIRRQRQSQGIEPRESEEIIHDPAKFDQRRGEGIQANSKVVDAEDDMAFRPKRDKKTNAFLAIFGCCTSTKNK